MKTLSAVESFTGGLFASSIVAKPGASEYFKGSLVAYANEVKLRIGVDIEGGVINKKAALDMAARGNEFFKSDVCVAFTGNAGPYPIEDKPVGLVYIAINDKVYEKQFAGDRNEIRLQAVQFALEKLKL